MSTAEPIAQQQSVFDATQTALDTANQQLLPDLAYSAAIQATQPVIEEQIQQEQAQQQADAVQQAVDTAQSAIDSVAIP